MRMASFAFLPSPSSVFVPSVSTERDLSSCATTERDSEVEELNPWGDLVERFPNRQSTFHKVDRMSFKKINDELAEELAGNGERSNARVSLHRDDYVDWLASAKKNKNIKKRALRVVFANLPRRQMDLEAMIAA